MNNYVLIGFMGCGKSTIGAALAETLKLPMLDTDAWIEEKQGRTISTIFAEDGEPAFRDMETACIRELIESEEAYVISTGGGLPMREENRALLKELGQVIYLKVSADEVCKRLAGDTTRPLLQCENPRARVEALLAEREAKYMAAADRVLCVDGKSVDEIVTEIL